MGEKDDDWDFYWADVGWMAETFDGMHLEAWQRVNHFRNDRELCRKVTTALGAAACASRGAFACHSPRVSVV